MDLNYFAKTVQAKCAGAGQKARQDLGSHPSLGGIDMQNRGFEPRNKYELGESFGMGLFFHRGVHDTSHISPRSKHPVLT